MIITLHSLMRFNGFTLMIQLVLFFTLYIPYKVKWRIPKLILKAWTIGFGNESVNKVINVISLVIYCLIFYILHVTFKRH